MKMNRNVKVLIVIILLFLTGAVGYFAYQRFVKPADTGRTACTLEAKLCPDGSYVGRTGPNCEFAECPKTATTTSVADTSNWKTYRNEKLGITLRYPQHDYFGEIKIIEDKNIVYVVHASADDYEYQKVQEVQKSGKTDMERTRGIPWAILTKYIDSDETLDRFIRERYGKGCNLEKKISSKTQEGVFDIDIGFDVPDPDSVFGTDCFINYITILKYHPSLKKVVAWDIGQDSNFRATSSSKDLQPLDFVMANSFRFLERNDRTDISTWKTYRNEKYGFEVKCPANFEINKSVVDSNSETPICSSSELKVYFQALQTSPDIAFVDRLTHFGRLRQEELERELDVIDIDGAPHREDPIGRELDKYKVNGVEALIFTKIYRDRSESYIYGCLDNGSKIIVEHSFLDCFVYISNIAVSATDGMKEDGDYKLFNQILSTFKFIK